MKIANAIAILRINNMKSLICLMLLVEVVDFHQVVAEEDFYLAVAEEDFHQFGHLLAQYNQRLMLPLILLDL